MCGRTACVVLSHLSVVHLNTRSIHRYERNEWQLYMNITNNLFPYLMRKFPREMGHYYSYNATNNRVTKSLAALPAALGGSAASHGHKPRGASKAGAAAGNFAAGALSSASTVHATSDGCWGV